MVERDGVPRRVEEEEEEERKGGARRSKGLKGWTGTTAAVAVANGNKGDDGGRFGPTQNHTSATSALEPRPGAHKTHVQVQGWPSMMGQIFGEIRKIMREKEGRKKRMLGMSSRTRGLRGTP